MIEEDCPNLQDNYLQFRWLTEELLSSYRNLQIQNNYRWLSNKAFVLYNEVLLFSHSNPVFALIITIFLVFIHRKLNQTWIFLSKGLKLDVKTY